MDDQRKAAYRDLIYHALVVIRAGDRKMNLIQPWKLRSSSRNLTQIKDLADALHNVAFFSIQDFSGFDETRFWEDVERLPQQNQELIQERFRWYLNQ